MNLGEIAAAASTAVNAILASPTEIVALLAAGIAAALVVISAFVRTMIPLRWLAVGSNAGFIVYGALHGSLVTLVLMATLLPINIFRAAEMTRLTRRVTKAAGASDLSGVWLKPYMKAKKIRAGKVLFRKGDQADHLYLLADGQIELVDIGKMLDAGKIFGEIAFFAPNKSRTHTARCVTNCTVLMIDESTLKQLYYQNPSFGFHLIELVAGRLTADIQRMESRLSGENTPPVVPEVSPALSEPARTPRSPPA